MTDPTHNQPGVIDPIPRHNPRAKRVPMSAPTHGFAKDEVRDFPWPSDPEVKNCELTYTGRVDLPAGAQLGPGIDMRVATVQGCSYDAATDKSTVFVEAVTPLPSVRDETAVHHFAQVVATSFNDHLAGMCKRIENRVELERILAAKAALG
jgi:hypothetical protein